jgi:hypothetical protein
MEFEGDVITFVARQLRADPAIRRLGYSHCDVILKGRFPDSIVVVNFTPDADTSSPRVALSWDFWTRNGPLFSPDGVDCSLSNYAAQELSMVASANCVEELIAVSDGAAPLGGIMSVSIEPSGDVRP